MSISRSFERWYDRLFGVINSAVCFSLAYIVLTFSFWFVMGLAGLIFKYDSFIYYYGIKYILNDRDWTKLKVTVLFSVSSFFCLGIGLLGFFLFQKIKRFDNLFNLFLIWLFVIGTGIFCAQGVVAALGANNYVSPYYQNFAVVYGWWHLPKIVVYLFALPLLFLLLFFAVNYAKPFLIVANSYSKVNTERRRKFFFAETALVPFFVGAVITTMVTYPMNTKVHLVYLGIIGFALVTSGLSLRYIKVAKSEMLRYTSLQALNPFFLFGLLVICYSVFIGWKGINLHVK